MKSAFVKSLITLSNKLESEHLAKNTNLPASVLWERQIDVNDKPYYTGLSENYLKCLVSSSTDISNSITSIKPKAIIEKYLLAN